MHQCINSIKDWVSENGFKFSSSKTGWIHFHQQYGFFPNPNTPLGKTPIKVVKETKFVGLICDTKHNQFKKKTCSIPYIFLSESS